MEIVISPRLFWAVFFGGFLASGIALVRSVRRGWKGPRWADAWDLFGIHKALISLGGGPEAHYRRLGLIFTGIGLLGLIRTILPG